MKVQTCNVELTKDVVRVTKEQPKVVRDVLHHFSGQISDMIRSGAYETMLVPYFGKFRPKTKRIQKIYNNRGKINILWNYSGSLKHTS